MNDWEVTFDIEEDTTLEADFVVFASSPYTIGRGLKEENGVLSLKEAGKDSFGGVKVGENIDVDSSATISVPQATEETKGVSEFASTEETISGLEQGKTVSPYTLAQTLKYTHVQRVASNVWTIEHNLNRVPHVTIVDSAGNVVEGGEKVINENVIKLYFKGGFKGKAYLS